MESRDDPRVQEVIQLLIHWLNYELAPQRIVVKHIQEDLYDGQIIQKLTEKLANIKVCVSCLLEAYAICIPCFPNISL